MSVLMQALMRLDLKIYIADPYKREFSALSAHPLDRLAVEADEVTQLC